VLASDEMTRPSPIAGRGVTWRWWIDDSPARPGLHERQPLDRLDLLDPLDRLVRDPEGVLAGPGSVARERAGRKRFYRVESPDAAPALFVKEFRVPPGAARVRTLLRRSKARREREVARRIERAGFVVAAPIAVGEARRLGLLQTSLSVVVEVPARDLRSWLLDPELAASARRALLTSFAQLLAKMHGAGVDQDDTSPNNFLAPDPTSPAAEWVLIDFERCSLGSPLGTRRWTLLAKLQRQELGVSRTDRLRFLRVYLEACGEPADRAARRRAWELIEPEFTRVRRRDARRAADGAFQLGRHVGREGDTWFIHGRNSRPVQRLDLPAAEARLAWTRAQQLERLSLPALRPVRLVPQGIELERPESARPAGPEDAAALARSRRQLERFGTLSDATGDVKWLISEGRALLCDPRAFTPDV